MDMDKTAVGVLDAEEQTQAISAPVEGATQMAMNVDCPVCHTPNPPSETYCIDCGFLLNAQPVAVADMPELPSMGKLVTPDGTREFPLSPGANSVGRESADILLSHNTVSRKHATVTVEEGHAYVEDTGSTNGTFVAGQKLSVEEKVELTDGSDVVFGSFSLKYQAAESGEQRAESEEPAESRERRAESEEPAESREPRAESEEPAGLEVEEAPSPGGEGGGEGAAPAESEEPSETAAVGRLVSKDGTCSFDIREGTNTIGRRVGDNDIVVPDPYCSGRHADLSFEDGKFTITDIGSSNGTFVNGAKLEPNEPRELATEDEITLGQMPFRLEVA